MPYVPNADNVAEPTTSETVKSAAQEFRTIKEKLARAITVPEVGEVPELPNAATRGGRVLAFDIGTGNPTASPFTVSQVQNAIVAAYASGAVDTEVDPTNPAYGAMGDGVTNDSAALLLAMATGRVVNGRGRSYGVSGILQPAFGFAGLINANLIQLAPATDNCRTLFVTALTNFVLRDVYVNRNGNASGGTLENFAGIYISSCTNFDAYRLSASGGGAGMGIRITNCSKFDVYRPHVANIVYDLAVAPADDIINGIFIQNSNNFTVFHPTVEDCGGLVLGVPTDRRSRGLVVGNCTRFDIYAPRVARVDQGVDFTGSGGNTYFNIFGGTAEDCFTFGAKFAGSSAYGRVYGFTSIGSGLMNFVISGQVAVDQILPVDLHFIDCLAINAGAGDGGVFWAGGGNIAGFRVMSSASIDASYPRGVKFIRCKAIDDQALHTMDFGFASDVARTGATFAYNELIECEAEGATTAKFSGFNSPYAGVTKNANQSIPDNAYSEINWQTEAYDLGPIHDTGSNINLVFIDQPGIYLLTTRAEFAANAVGTRGIKFAVSGAPIAHSEVVVPAAAAGTTRLTTTTVFRAVQSNNVEVEVFQNSGGALDILSAGCGFEVSLIKRLPN